MKTGTARMESLVEGGDRGINPMVSHGMPTVVGEGTMDTGQTLPHQTNMRKRAGVRQATVGLLGDGDAVLHLCFNSY